MFFFERSSLVAGTRNLANEQRGRSSTASKDYANDRRAFATIGTHFLALLHAAARDGKVRALRSRDYEPSVQLFLFFFLTYELLKLVFLI